jgi:hypothetical protein
MVTREAGLAGVVPVSCVVESSGVTASSEGVRDTAIFVEVGVEVSLVEATTSDPGGGVIFSEREKLHAARPRLSSRVKRAVVDFMIILE